MKILKLSAAGLVVLTLFDPALVLHGALRLVQASMLLCAAAALLTLVGVFGWDLVKACRKFL